MRQRRRAAGGLIAQLARASGVLLASLVGCERAAQAPSAAVSPPVSVRASSVTGAAAESRAATGKFELPSPEATPLPIVSEQEARARAEIWVRGPGKKVRSALESDHGSRIELESLQICDRAFFARTPFEPLAAGTPNFVRNAHGPWWIIPFCTPSGVHQITVGVAAYSTDVRIENGRLKFPLRHGTEFVVAGVRPDRTIPMTPEHATELVAQATGRRVKSVPELVLSGQYDSPLLARWRVRLDAPVRVQASTTSATDTAAELFVRQDPDRRTPTISIRDPRGARSLNRSYPLPRESPKAEKRRVSHRAAARPGYPLQL